MAREWPRHGNSPAPRPAEVDAEGYDDPESALLNIIAHTAHDEHAPRELLAGLLASVLRIADAALARLRSEPDPYNIVGELQDAHHRIGELEAEIAQMRRVGVIPQPGIAGNSAPGWPSIQPTTNASQISSSRCARIVGSPPPERGLVFGSPEHIDQVLSDLASVFCAIHAGTEVDVGVVGRLPTPWFDLAAAFRDALAPPGRQPDGWANAEDWAASRGALRSEHQTDVGLSHKPLDPTDLPVHVGARPAKRGTVKQVADLLADGLKLDDEERDHIIATTRAETLAEVREECQLRACEQTHGEAGAALERFSSWLDRLATEGGGS